MQSLKIILAAAIIIFASNLLTGCAPQGPSAIGIKRIESAQEFKKTVRLKLVDISGEEAPELRIILENPEGKAITSVQAWLSFNPDVIKGLAINTDESAFELTAPYDNDFDQEAGLVMIGRSTETALSDAEIVVADVSFERVGEGALMIEAYDYRNDLEGHTSANMVKDRTPYNILLKPDSPLISITQ
jgi:hypothetical protein